MSSVLNCFSQSASEIIEKIQDQYRAINVFAETADFRRIRFQDESVKESELVVFMDDQLPVKISVTIVSDSEKQEKVFYFDKTGLIYVVIERTIFSRVPRWEEAKSLELGESEFRDASTVRVEKNYFSFKNDNLLKWNSHDSITPGDDAFIRMQRELIEEAENLVNRLK